MRFLLVIFSLTILSSGVFGRAVRTANMRSNFDYNSFYDEVSRPAKTQALTPEGVVLRQFTNPTDTVDQIRSSGFTSITCDIGTRTWFVEYANALDERVWGPTVMSALGECQANPEDFPNPLPLIAQDSTLNVTTVNGRVVTSLQFILTEPNVNQNILRCTFELFLINEMNTNMLAPPRRFDTRLHECDRKDGQTCKFWELFCLIDIDEFKGAAVFWDFIIAIEILVFVAIGLIIFMLDISRSADLLSDLSNQLSTETVNGRNSYSASEVDRMSMNEIDDSLSLLRERELKSAYVAGGGNENLGGPGVFGGRAPDPQPGFISGNFRGLMSGARQRTLVSNRGGQSSQSLLSRQSSDRSQWGGDMTEQEI